MEYGNILIFSYAHNPILILVILNKLKAMYNTSVEHTMANENDLNSAATAISKIQQLYQVNATEIASGKAIYTKYIIFI